MDIYSYLKDYIDSMPGGEEGFLKQWGTDQLANRLLDEDFGVENRIGICGVHRSGKTTLAKSITYTIAGYEYRDGSASPTLNRLKVDVRDVPNLGINKRFEIQQEITKDYSNLIKGHNIVIDRTPLDHLMYTIAEIIPNSIDEGVYEAYKDLCLNLLKGFKCIILLHPGIKIVDDKSKASPDTAYIDHLDNIITGLVYNNRNNINEIIEIPKETTDLHDRVSLVQERLELLCIN